MSSKYIKIFFTPLIIVEILISTTARYYFTPLPCDYFQLQ